MADLVGFTLSEHVYHQQSHVILTTLLLSEFTQVSHLTVCITMNSSHFLFAKLVNNYLVLTRREMYLISRLNVATVVLMEVSELNWPGSLSHWISLIDIEILISTALLNAPLMWNLYLLSSYTEHVFCQCVDPWREGVKVHWACWRATSVLMKLEF